MPFGPLTTPILVSRYLKHVCTVRTPFGVNQNFWDWRQLLLRALNRHKCCSIANELPWAEHLTSLVDTLPSVFAFNHKRVPVLCLKATQCPQIVYTIMYNKIINDFKDNTQHSEQHHITESVVLLAMCAALATSVYTKVPCSNLQWSNTGMHNTQGCAWLSKLHGVYSISNMKLTSGWALTWVNLTLYRKLNQK